MAYDEPWYKRPRRRRTRAVLITMVLTVVLGPSGYIAIAERLAVEVALLGVGYVGDQIFTDEPGLSIDDPNVADGSQGGSVNGSADVLYGGTAHTASCNRKKLIEFLERPENADKAEVWAQVHGIPRSGIRSYINGLTPVVLLRDTLVMNHGYKRQGNKGRANRFHAILEAGVAVLVDQYGVPAVRCACGNPLTAPDIGIAFRIHYTGQPWGNYKEERKTVVKKKSKVHGLVLHNKPGQAVFRQVGTDGEGDVTVRLEPDPPPPTSSSSKPSPDPTIPNTSSTTVSPTSTKPPGPTQHSSAAVPWPTTSR